MQFKQWILIESSLEDLYQSAIDAFPATTKRQNSIDTIRIAKLHWTPFEGIRTLFLKGLAQNEGNEYNPIIVFKNTKYVDYKGPNIVEFVDSIGKRRLIEKLSTNNDVIIRCNCPDFYWRFNYFNHLDKSLFGRKRAKYEAKYRPGSANPEEMPGMCKHIMKMIKVLEESGLIQ